MSCAAGKLDRSSLTDVNLENLFVSMAKGNDPKADGRTMAIKDAEQWLSKANIADGKQITQAHLSAAIKEMGKNTLDFTDFTRILSDLANNKQVNMQTLKEKLLKVKT